MEISTIKNTTLHLTYINKDKEEKKEIKTTDKRLSFILSQKVKNIFIETDNNVLLDTVVIKNTTNSDALLYDSINSNKFQQTANLKGKKHFNYAGNLFCLGLITVALFVFFIFIFNNEKLLNACFEKPICISNAKFKNLEFLRFIFAIFIVMTHIGMMSNGAVVVECFFIISGFLLYKSIENIDNISIKNFIFKRYIRLFPLFLFCILFFRYQNLIQSIFGMDIVLYGRDIIIKTDYRLWYPPVVFWAGIYIFLLFKTLKKKWHYLYWESRLMFV